MNKQEVRVAYAFVLTATLLFALLHGFSNRFSAAHVVGHVAVALTLTTLMMVMGIPGFRFAYSTPSRNSQLLRLGMVIAVLVIPSALVAWIGFATKLPFIDFQAASLAVAAVMAYMVGNGDPLFKRNDSVDNSA